MLKIGGTVVYLVRYLPKGWNHLPKDDFVVVSNDSVVNGSGISGVVRYEPFPDHTLLSVVFLSFFISSILKAGLFE